MMDVRSTGRSETQLRAVVVDDSQFMRTVIADALEEEGIAAVATAPDGAEGVAAVKEHDPDVVTMDLNMPGVDGIEAVDRIMSECPTPVLVLSAHAADGADATFEALEHGAVDFFEKPSGELSVGIKQVQSDLAASVQSVASADVSRGSLAATATPTTVTVSGAATRQSGRRYLDDPTLVVGSSTGGPPVVEKLLAELPLAAGLRVLVVQHMPEGFTDRFAERLDDASDYTVLEATDGMRIGSGEAVVARGDRHMRISGYSGGRIRVALTESAPINSVRPAVDVTLRSAAEHVDGPLIAAILTGMGSDGASGVRDVSDVGGTVIVQDRETSAVFGMPQRAIETGVVDDVRPRTELARGVLEAITTDRR